MTNTEAAQVASTLTAAVAQLPTDRRPTYLEVEAAVALCAASRGTERFQVDMTTDVCHYISRGRTWAPTCIVAAWL